jgi:hypothetical protein
LTLEAASTVRVRSPEHPAGKIYRLRRVRELRPSELQAVTDASTRAQAAADSQRTQHARAQLKRELERVVAIFLPSLERSVRRDLDLDALSSIVHLVRKEATP